MPFKRMANGKYKSPSGRVMTGAQVRAYYAKKKRARPAPKKPKGRRRHPIGKAGMGG